jgi:purine-binding chemotaxis protein CheW
MLEELRRQLNARLTADIPPQSGVFHEGMQFLAFRVASQDMLAPVENVREIIMPPPITWLPHSQAEIEGVIALRGEILPLVNLRRLLGFQQGQHSPATRVLIVRPEDDQFGIIVDEITDFVWLAEADLHAVQKSYLSEEFKVVSKVAKTAGTVRPVLDVVTVLKSVFPDGGDDDTGIL